ELNPATCFETLSLHDALPIAAPPPIALPRGPGRAPDRFGGYARSPPWGRGRRARGRRSGRSPPGARGGCHRRLRGRSRRTSTGQDRKSTRLNSSHVKISYAVV